MDDRGLVMVSRHAMATRFEIALAGAEPHRLRAAGEEALDEISRAEEMYSAFLPSSLTYHINERAGLRPVRIGHEALLGLEGIVAMCRATGGAFDVTVRPLLRAWGLTGEREPGTDAEIEEARALTGTHHIKLGWDDWTVSFDRPGVELDFGAVGKGVALDSAAAALRQCGVLSGLIHGGTSSATAIGTHGDSRGWRVAVADPYDPGRALAETWLYDSSLGVSCNAGKTVVRNGEVVGHIIDPRTGRPAQGAVLAAVAARDAAFCDAFSTALVVLGEEGLEIPELCSGAVSCLVALRRGDGGLNIVTTGSYWQGESPGPLIPEQEGISEP
jgi:thiamine biosynthesis lipoprotein